MAKIIKIAPSTSAPRIVNQFRTSRNSTTNPFKYQNFEGNTLDISAFADVFDSSASKGTSKMKLIASSVAGSMHKFRVGITEPIRQFAKKVYEGISSAWDYAKNTNISDLGAETIKGFNSLMSSQIEIPGLRGLDEMIHKPIELPDIKSIGSAVGGRIKTNMSSVGEGLVCLGNGIKEGCMKIVSKNGSKISADMPVSTLRELLEAELAGIHVEAA